MKVEKCPHCGGQLEYYKIHPFFWMVGCLTDCTTPFICTDYMAFGWTKLTATLRYNRWARREKRRMEKKGANQ